MGRKILADAGYEVITVNNGSAALKKIAEQKPDLIVLDVYMPGYSGLEVCQRLKEAQETSRVPVLLTVGKLEPFKPEEARRARADGFIVKPFEASELLSALSKMEDKIVPRSETSKPGRFARANAALDEGRYDKTVAVDEDSGWKNRISFPSKKKEKEKVQPEDGDDPAIYNAVNKDLRTVVEHKLAEPQHEPKAEETKVDLGALAPEGLPKDVTPEEIAALAAAAAQVKGKIAESRQEEPLPEVAKTEPKTEPIEPATPAAEVLPTVAAASPAATFAEQKSEEKAEQKTEQKIEASNETTNVAVPSASDVTAAIASLEADAGKSVSASSGSWANTSIDRSADEPVTMAVAAGAGPATTSSRWTAVSVALVPEESALSLEHEMQKAYAAFAAAESGHSGPSSSSEESKAVSAEPAATTEAATVPATPAPEAAQTLSEVANAATDAISAAVKELEAVAASYVEQKTSAAVEPDSAPVEKADQMIQVATEPVQAVAPSAEESSASRFSEPDSETSKLESAKSDAVQASVEGPVSPATADSKIDDPKSEDTKIGDSKNEDSKSYDSKDEVPAPVVAEVTALPEEESEANAAAPKTPTSTFVDEVRAEQSSASHVSDVAPLTTGESAVGGTRDMAKKESEIAANTAAAWASWRRIRESGDPKSASPETSHKEIEDPQDAAMAVAAGAEKTPEEGSSESDPEGIASIVDSVLAEMRPKIYEEISRKMGKKK
jgi:CheY-like chemotaxis protein